MSTQDLEQLVKRLESVATRLEASESRIGGGSSVSAVEVAAFVSAYDEIVSGPFVEYLKLSRQIGGDVAEHAAMVETAFNLQRGFIELASKSKKPSTDQFVALLKPQSDQIQSIQQFRETKRSSALFNHLTAISESIPALGWVAVSPTPAPYVKEMSDACQFYTNRVIKDFKEKDKKHVEWTKVWLQVLSQLQAYIKQHHITGLVWNPKGGDATALKPAPVSSAARGAPAPPPPPAGLPPPPPPPSADFLLGKTGGDDGSDTRAALFASLNKGSDITKGLKKVSADQMTHKNPNLRTSSVVPAKETAAPSGKPATAPKPVALKPPKCELDGKKWVVEFQRDVPQLVLDDVHMNQVVYVYGCFNSVIIIKGKCNSVSVDNCKKTSIVFDNIVSTVEFINCQSVKAQALGAVPTISVDKTDGAHIYLSPTCLQTEVVTSKSSEVNVSVPQGTEGDYTECPIPEQFKSTWNGKAMKTEILDVAA